MPTRLNGIIRRLERGEIAVAAFATPDIPTALSFATSPYDGIVFEGEHNAWNSESLRDSLQYLLDRAQIAKSGSVAPSVTPIVRIPANGVEMSQVYAKQALDMGAYGIVWPHISNATQAYNAVAACRYPRLPSAGHFEPQGIRGDGGSGASRYWGLPRTEYYRRAGVWPLDPDGELLVTLMIEDTAGISNLPEILSQVPGVGMILIGEGDLSQELGHPREYDHPDVRAGVAQVVATCKRFGVPVGHPHATEKNVSRLVSEGFQFLLAAPARTYPTLDAVRGLNEQMAT